MAFALSIIKLEEALKKPGCPVCRLEHNAAFSAIDAFLWENVNDPEMRKPINDALGFCPDHTRLLVAAELSNSGHALGVNIIYKLLAKIASEDLKSHQRQQKSAKLLGFFRKIFKPSADQIDSRFRLLKPSGPCPVCSEIHRLGLNSLSDLFEELENESSNLTSLYQDSSGLCLSHLRSGVSTFEDKFPDAARFLIQDTIQRLDQQRVDMQRYIDKQDWNLRDDKLSLEERMAWLRTLTFFTGYPKDKFSFRPDEF